MKTVSRVLARAGARRARRAGGRARRTRSATSRSTASAASRSPATASTSVYVLDLAEIPTFQARRAERRRRPRLRRAGSRASAHADASTATACRSSPLRHAHRASRRGAGGLHTTRLEVVFAARRSTATRRRPIADRDLRDRIGWREIVVRAERRARRRARPPATSVSDAPAPTRTDLLHEPARRHDGDRRASTPGSGQASPPALSTGGGAATAPRPRSHDGGFASLVAQRDLSLRRDPRLAAARAVLGRGARAHARARQGDRRRATSSARRARRAHALAARRDRHGHAHDRRLRARARHARALASSSSPSTLYPWLNLVSAAARRRRRRRPCCAAARSAARATARPGRPSRHSHHHDHGHDHVTTTTTATTTHAPSRPRRAAATAGTSRGLLGRRRSRAGCCRARRRSSSCSARSRSTASRFGLVLIVAFSLGLAAVISGIGLARDRRARRASGGMTFDGPLVRALPAVSALLILGVGVAMTIRALPRLSERSRSSEPFAISANNSQLAHRFREQRRALDGRRWIEQAADGASGSARFLVGGRRRRGGRRPRGTLARAGDGRQATLEVATTVAPITSIVANIGGDPRPDHRGSSPRGRTRTRSSRSRAPPCSSRRSTSSTSTASSSRTRPRELADENLKNGAAIVELGKQLHRREGLDLRLLVPEVRRQAEPAPLDRSALRALLRQGRPRRLLEARSRQTRPTTPRTTAKFKTMIAQLDKAMRTSFATIPKRELLTYHDAYAYFGKDYGCDDRSARSRSPTSRTRPRRRSSA